MLDSACAELSQLNPYRYRGYYYDTETGLYFLKTRYYDPEVGRFITIDDLSYIDPEIINGLNLYAYCTNNPVMNVDINGTSLRSIWNRLKVGVKNAYNNFKRNIIDSWNGFVDNVFNLPDKIGNTIGAIVENASVSGGIGLGIGFTINVFRLFGISAIYKTDFFNIMIDGTGIHIGGSGEKSFGFIIMNYWSKMWGIEEFMPYGGSTPTVSKKNWEFSLGIGGYFVYGFNLGFSVDLKGLFKEFKKIWGIV